jgi:hypothetical protein
MALPIHRQHRSMVNAARWLAPFYLVMLRCFVVHGFIPNNAGVPLRFHTTSTTTFLDSTMISSLPPSLLSSLNGIQIAMRSPAFSSGIASGCYRYCLSPFDTRLKEKLNNNDEDYSFTAASDNNNDDDEVLVEDVLELVTDFRGRPAGVVMEDLNWRVHKLRLEEANTRRFLKAGPRFLPYEECRKWVQAWGNRWQTASEW